MSFFHKKMSQNFWATNMPFGPVTLIFYWPKQIFSGQPRLALISGTVTITYIALVLPRKSVKHSSWKKLSYCFKL